MKKGEIRTIDLPGSYGTDQKGMRPSVIIAQADANIVIVIPFTSNVQALRYKNTLLIEPSLRNGLTVESIALIFQNRAVDKHRILNKIGELEEDYLTEIDEMLANMLKIAKK